MFKFLFIFALTFSSVYADDKLLTFQGEVVFVEIEGGFYGIIDQNGQKYLPSNLPGNLKKDGLKVRGTAQLKSGKLGFKQWGKMIDIIEIIYQQ
jgi:hypothetical protein